MNSTIPLHDISQFPKDKGMLIFPISLSRIGNAQSADKCFEYLQHLDTKIKKTDGIGATFLYGDYLYLLTAKESPKELRTRYLAQMTQHKNALLKILEKDTAWVTGFFSFITYGQTLVDFSRVFSKYWQTVLDLYKEDTLLQQCVAIDSCGKVSEEQKHFILEESVLFHLIKKRVLSFDNQIINHHEKWVLEVYPGKPLATEIYLMQKNIFELDDKANIFQNHFYDADSKVLHDLTTIDIKDFYQVP